MATFRAIAATCDAIMYLLRSSHDPSDFDNPLEFRVFLTPDFSQTSTLAGVSLFLYRIYPNGTYRNPAGRLTPEGRRAPQLPLDLHFLLTVWGGEASLQHTIAGWMMRVLEDNAILPAGLLNTVAPGVFRPDETVEITPTDLRTEDLLRIWDTIIQNVYQLSVPYVARNIWLESIEPTVGVGEPVQDREFEYTKRQQP